VYRGSGQWWDDPNLDLTNQIPAAIGEKIASMIRAKKDFAVYVVCPLFPEGYACCRIFGIAWLGKCMGKR
jgi:hypothetical protein